MTNKEAALARWKKVPKEVRSERGRHAATAKWAAMTAEDRRAHCRMMYEAKKKTDTV